MRHHLPSLWAPLIVRNSLKPAGNQMSHYSNEKTFLSSTLVPFDSTEFGLYTFHRISIFRQRRSPTTIVQAEPGGFWYATRVLYYTVWDRKILHFSTTRLTVSCQTFNKNQCKNQSNHNDLNPSYRPTRAFPDMLLQLLLRPNLVPAEMDKAIRVWLGRISPPKRCK